MQFVSSLLMYTNDDPLLERAHYCHTFRLFWRNAKLSLKVIEKAAVYIGVFMINVLFMVLSYSQPKPQNHQNAIVLYRTVSSHHYACFYNNRNKLNIKLTLSVKHIARMQLKKII